MRRSRATFDDGDNRPKPLAKAAQWHRETLIERKRIKLAFKKVARINDHRGFQYIAGIHGYPQQYCHRIHPVTLTNSFLAPYAMMR